VTSTIKKPYEEGKVRAAQNPDQPPQTVRRWVLLATILGSSMVFIDGTVVNVALPVLQTDLRAGVSEVQWIVEAYALFLSALLLVGGALGDRYGRRAIYVAGIVLFAVASIWCGLAPDAGQLIVARAVQGIGGALLVPGSLAIISATFPKEERGRAIGTWSGFTAITTAFGPVLGGFLVEQASWRWVFYINVPLAMAVLGLVFWKMPESRDESASGRLDWAGALLATIGLGGLVYGLIESSNLGWDSPVVLTALVVGVLALVLFVVVEARSRTPMMPLALFRSHTFSGTNLLTLFLYGALGATFFFFPFDLIQVQGYSPTAAGAALLPFVLLLFALSRWSGGLINSFGSKLPLVVGPVIAAIGFALFALPGTGGSYWTTYFPAAVVLGLGFAVTVAPLTTAVMGAVDVRHSGVASGVNNAVSRTAGLVAIAVLGIVMLGAFNSSLDGRMGPLEVSPQVRQAIDSQRNKLAAAEIPATVDAQTRSKLKVALDESFLDGFRLVMIINAGLALASALAAALLVEGKAPADESSEQTVAEGGAI
jgi:EmrB/QacA subfamily drug resistance transporter